MTGAGGLLLVPMPSGRPGGGLSRQAGLRELHLTLPAQRRLLWPLWECCAICWPQTFYEQEDRKKFSSIDRSQACSLPLLFIGLLGDEGDKTKTGLTAEPRGTASSQCPFPQLPQGRTPNGRCPTRRWHRGAGRPGSRRPQPWGRHPPGLGVPRRFTQTTRKEKSRIWGENRAQNYIYSM